MKPNEHEQARAWRERLGLTQTELGNLVGYSLESVYWFEQGRTPPSKTRKRRVIDPRVWHRYKMACAGAAQALKSRRNWAWT